LTAVALGQALVVAVIATAGFHISGGHINPAVTLSLAVGGHITLFRSALYIVAQMLGSSTACILLRWLTGGLATPVHALAAGVAPIQGVVAEIVFTFSLLFVIYATILDPRKLLPGVGPLLTGLLVGANSIAGAVLSGASMNPARSFGPAVATGVWTHHWVQCTGSGRWSVAPSLCWCTSASSWRPPAHTSCCLRRRERVAGRGALDYWREFNLLGPATSDVE
ncbi:Aquaporin TIP4-3, partial [Dichanthelium oligosanthes]